MMKKQLLTSAAALLVLLGSTQVVLAQRSRDAGASLIEVVSTKERAKKLKATGETAANGIQVAVKTTPRFELSDENQDSVSKNDRKNIVPWIEITVPFVTVPAAKDKSAKGKSNPAAQPTSWLENVEVYVEMLTPVLNNQGRMEFGVLSGSATLAPVRNYHPANSGEKGSVTHNVKFYVSPYIVSRYIASLGLSGEKLRAMIATCPVRVMFRHNNKAYTGQFVQEKEFGEQVKMIEQENGEKISLPRNIGSASVGGLFKMYDSDSRSLLGISEIIPASKTPWAWIGYDFQEHTLDEAVRR